MPKSKKNHIKSHRKSHKKYKYIRNTRRLRNSHNLRGGSSGNDIRQQLVTLCRKKDWVAYDALTQQIMKDYWVNGKKDFFIHLDRNIHNFTPSSLSCLKLSLTQLQEDAIPESMPHLHYIMSRGL